MLATMSNSIKRKTADEHTSKRRLDLGLMQKDVALAGDQKTITVRRLMTFAEERLPELSRVHLEVFRQNSKR
jgi:hypothetical protein